MIGYSAICGSGRGGAAWAGGGVFSVAENVVENFAEFSLDNMLIEKKTETDKSADKGEMSEAEKAMESLTDDLVVPLQE